MEKFVDIRLTPEGDFELDETGDLVLTNLSQLVEQKVNIALKTSNPDWFGDMIGADLEDLLGQEHTKETSELGKKMITSSLTAHGFFEDDNIYVEAKPYNKSTILFMLFVNIPEIGESQVYRISLDLGNGAVLRRIT